jgi:hypothetical protein
MLHLWDELICQVFHSRWSTVVSYSRQGDSTCLKKECRAQRRIDQGRARQTNRAAIIYFPGSSPGWQLRGRIHPRLGTRS